MRGTRVSCRGWEWSTGSAVCGAQRVVGSVWYAVPGMRCVVCIALFTITYQCVWYAVCGMRKQWSTGIAAGLISSILSALHSPVSEPHNFEFHFLCLSSFWLEALDNHQINLIAIYLQTQPFTDHWRRFKITYDNRWWSGKYLVLVRDLYSSLLFCLVWRC